MERQPRWKIILYVYLISCGKKSTEERGRVPLVGLLLFSFLIQTCNREFIHQCDIYGLRVSDKSHRLVGVVSLGRQKPMCTVVVLESQWKHKPCLRPFWDIFEQKCLFTFYCVDFFKIRRQFQAVRPQKCKNENNSIFHTYISSSYKKDLRVVCFFLAQLYVC